MGTCQNFKRTVFCKCKQIENKELSDILPIQNKSNKSTTKYNQLQLIKKSLSSSNNDNNDSFEMKFLNEINFVRHSPALYFNKLKSMEKQIKINNNKAVLYPKNKGNPILIKGGMESFDRALELLKVQDKLNELKWNEELKINFFMKFIDKKTFESDIIKCIKMKQNELKKKNLESFYIIHYFEDPDINIFLDIVNNDCLNNINKNIIFSKNISQLGTAYRKINDNMFTAVSTCV